VVQERGVLFFGGEERERERKTSISQASFSFLLSTYVLDTILIEA
jgi:hypothetical protein